MSELLTIEEMLEGAERELRPATTLQAPPPFDREAFYDVLIDRWRAGERSTALWDALRRIPEMFDLEIEVYALNAPGIDQDKANICARHRHLRPCPHCEGGSIDDGDDDARDRAGARRSYKDFAGSLTDIGG